MGRKQKGLKTNDMTEVVPDSGAVAESSRLEPGWQARAGLLLPTLQCL